MLRVFFLVAVLCGLGSLRAEVPAGTDLPDPVAALSTRYAPYADWAALVDVDALTVSSGQPYWRSAETIRKERKAGALPLAGLRLALDPGHVGGVWAEAEGRHFKIAAEDFPVCEGELVLEVARRVREQLVALGAEVSLLRDRCDPINPKGPIDYLEQAGQQVAPPQQMTWAALTAYAQALQARATRLSIVTGELFERARLVNEVIRPDALISLHINAAPWPSVAAAAPSEPGQGTSAAEAVKNPLRLVSANHVHALIFGCLSDAELHSTRQRQQMLVKLTNGSGEEELRLGTALAEALAEATALPAASYEGKKNAIRLEADNSYLWARNLMILRMAECPAVLLEPYVANSKDAYARIQSALANRASGVQPAPDDILVEYADAVVAGVLKAYGP